MTRKGNESFPTLFAFFIINMGGYVCVGGGGGGGLEGVCEYFLMQVLVNLVIISIPKVSRLIKKATNFLLTVLPTKIVCFFSH